MNRIDPLTLEPWTHATSTTYELEPGGLDLDTSDEVDEASPHALFVPLHYEANYRYPLIVWLHGPRNNELELRRIMPLVSMRNYVAVGPRGTLAIDPEGDGIGYSWWQSEDHILLAERRVFGAIQVAMSKLSIAPSRIFLAGYGDGGTMALRVALNNPERFAGAISLGGEFPRGLRPLWRLNDVRRLPLLLANGLASTAYPETRVCEDLRLFHAAGLSVAMRQYPCGDELTTVMLEDMDRWIMRIVCPSDASLAPNVH